MTASLSFVNTPSQALKGKQHAVLVASQRALKAGVWKKVFSGDWTAVLTKLVKDAEPGRLGSVVTTYTGGESPRKVSLIVLPNTLSRHLSASRAIAVEASARKLSLGNATKAGVIFCLDKAEHYVAVGNAFGRAFPLYHRKSKASKKVAISLAAIDSKGASIKAPAIVGQTTAAGRWAASLVDMPASELDAAAFEREAKKGLKGIKGVKVTSIVGAALLKAGCGGIHGVGRAAKSAPRLLICEAGPKSAKRTVAIVGKGVVYDTGGLNIKTGGGMYGMKCDMGGGAAVLGAFKVLAQQSPKDRIYCLVPLAENAISEEAYRPDDVLDMHSGKTVEINNTDAEGRLLLADAVSYASRKLKADVVIDAATLTGAQLLATGKRHASVVSNRAGLEATALKAGLTSGDEVAALPFAPEIYQAEFSSAVADMRNSVKDRANAQTSCAGQFVYSHMQDTGKAWLHIDLAGPAMPGRRATGYGVALVSEVVQSLTASALKK